MYGDDIFKGPLIIVLFMIKTLKMKTFSITIVPVLMTKANMNFPMIKSDVSKSLLLILSTVSTITSRSIFLNKDGLWPVADDDKDFVDSQIKIDSNDREKLIITRIKDNRYLVNSKHF